MLDYLELNTYLSRNLKLLYFKPVNWQTTYWNNTCIFLEVRVSNNYKQAKFIFADLRSNYIFHEIRGFILKDNIYTTNFKIAFKLWRQLAVQYCIFLLILKRELNFDPWLHKMQLKITTFIFLHEKGADLNLSFLCPNSHFYSFIPLTFVNSHFVCHSTSRNAFTPSKVIKCVTWKRDPTRWSTVYIHSSTLPLHVISFHFLFKRS